MKKIILFIAALLLINYSNAQEQKVNYYNLVKANVKEIGKVDENRFPIGEWNYYLENGILDYSINWDTNFFIKYYLTGEIKEKGTFIPETGVHIGEWITYNLSGEIMTKIVYDKNGDLISDSHIKKQ